MDNTNLKSPWGIYFRGVRGEADFKPYPAWRYHKCLEPIIVHDTEEDENANKKGFLAPCSPVTANTGLVNWFWDLEDMSPKQLVVYADDEYGVKLPLEAGQEELFRAILELGKSAPQNRNRLVLLAHTIRMNYEETLDEIRRMVNHPPEGAEVKTETLEFYY